MEKHYLFVEMPVWKRAVETKTIIKIFHLSQTYRIIMSETQLESLRSYYFGDEYYLVEDLFNGNDEENNKNFNELTQLYPRLANYYYNFHTLIYDHISIILKHDDISVEQSDDRIFNNKPPFYNTLDYMGDVLSWTSIIASPIIEERFDLYVYTNTDNFLFHKKLHPMLCFDWKAHKKGILRLFDSLKPPVEYKIQENLTVKKVINKNSPQYMTQRFTNLSELLVTEFTNKTPEIHDIQTMLQECRFIVERLKFNIPDELLLNMKKKVSDFGSKYEELLNQREITRKNRPTR